MSKPPRDPEGKQPRGGPAGRAPKGDAQAKRKLPKLNVAGHGNPARRPPKDPYGKKPGK